MPSTKLEYSLVHEKNPRSVPWTGICRWKNSHDPTVLSPVAVVWLRHVPARKEPARESSLIRTRQQQRERKEQVQARQNDVHAPLARKVKTPLPILWIRRSASNLPGRVRIGLQQIAISGSGRVRSDGRVLSNDSNGRRGRMF